ncbi:MAG: Rab family GTPase [Candidatus Hodarchaeota archaeon]
MEKTVHYSCKVVMLGEGSVGKTSLIRRYVKQTFTHDYITTVGSNFLIKKIQLDEESRMTMQLWDISGQDSFRNIRPQYYLHSHGGILTFDLTRNTTLQELEKWYMDFTKKTGHIPLMMFGNKVDLRDQREVLVEDAQMLAHRFNANYFETSALDGTGVEEAFTILAQRIVDHIDTRVKKLKSE